VVPFDVPGHKRGRGNPDLAAFLGPQALALDVNSMAALDFLGNPVSVIKEAETLAALAFGAKAAFFMVGGTTSSVQAMVLSACKSGDKILLPRNVHVSVITALILSGAVPYYIDPGIHEDFGISLGMDYSDVKKAILANPDAKAILLNNPTYYGICSDIKSITELAHAHNMLVLADEAHGTHFSFSSDSPISAMSAGADMAAVSMHKSGGSLTQSSILLLGQHPDPAYVRQIINLTQTTSASYLLLSSLDISRRNLALNGERIFAKVSALADYARDEINAIGGFYAFGKDIIKSGGNIFDFDCTKLSVNSLRAGLAGIEVYDILRDEYDIQIEFGDIGNFLAYISIGDTKKDIERLCSALAEVLRIYRKDPKGMLDYEYIHPKVVLPPQTAFYGEKQNLPLDDARGRIAAEMAICYPPGIPILAPGEKITAEALDYIHYAKKMGCKFTGSQDPDVNNILVLK
jgi:lysine decarboxylase